VSDSLTRIENTSIRAFVQSAADEGYLSGRVLDYGCGKQPYRDIVQAAGGEYEPFDRAHFPGNTSGEDVLGYLVAPAYWNALLNTQVLQYVYDVPATLRKFHLLLADNGHLVLTYPTNWPEVEEVDLHRFTKAGMERLLAGAGFSILRHERRATVHAEGYEWALGYGVVARA
jgi:Methyltransferase domain